MIEPRLPTSPSRAARVGRALAVTLCSIALASCPAALRAQAAPPRTSTTQPAGAAADVTVEVTPVQVETRTFDPRNRPADMPELKPGEAAVTESHFICQTLVGAVVEDQQAPAGGRKASATAKVQSVKMTLKLEIVIWLPENGARKLTAHEEGHRRIDERFYERAKDVATEFSRKAIGRTYRAEGDTVDAAVQAAIQQAGNELCGHYMGQVQVPAARAQEIYDKTTDHGRNRVDEDEAIDRAILKVLSERQATAAPTTAQTPAS